MISQFLTAAAAIGLLGAGIASSGETRSFQALTASAAAASANVCRVDVVRTGAAGSADITRQNLSDGSCVCTIVTGPAEANGSAEATVESLRRGATCEGSLPASGATQAAGNGGVIIGVGFAVTAVAVGALAGSGSDSPTSS
jgi:hypothetical protein